MFNPSHDQSKLRLSPPARAAARLPLTFKGVAAYVQAPARHLILVELVVALIAAASMAWFFALACSPAIQAALTQLPEQGVFHSGQLEWPGNSTMLLGHTPFLEIAIDLDGTGQIGPSADLKWEFKRRELRFVTRFGQYALHYPAARSVPFNCTDLLPLWRTWHLWLIAGIVGFVVAVLLPGWAVLAAVYAVVARLAVPSFYHQWGWTGYWRLASAALMPGALWMSGTTLLYGLRGLGLTGFLLAFGAHFVIGWLYLGFALRQLNRPSPN